MSKHDVATPASPCLWVAMLLLAIAAATAICALGCGATASQLFPAATANTASAVEESLT